VALAGMFVLVSLLPSLVPPEWWRIFEQLKG